MKLKDILTKVGAGLLREAVPGGGLLVDSVNALLAPDTQISKTATGAQARQVLESKYPSLLEREFDVQETEIRESHETLRAAIAADVASPHSTRPFIAKGSFYVVAVTILTIVLSWSLSVVAGQTEQARILAEGWPFVLSAIGPLVGLLWAYFGILRRELDSRIDAANGKATKGGAIAGIVSALGGR